MARITRGSFTPAPLTSFSTISARASSSDRSDWAGAAALTTSNKKGDTYIFGGNLQRVGKECVMV